ncbi:GPW/gp25 family protein [Acidovorax sp. SUPP3334]|uniref:GPW/gp25 family protein n=1 Tax=Acidovorax sp. SUPP3334 TaxID=2920881 RepID=UPI0023DE323F|nr:GPW/gp25 family protein [Acidovorax sp. SUPP3334]GKT21646.1 GPW/gp25 family protein [Acidovorax sp. SUPP3334]
MDAIDTITASDWQLAIGLPGKAVTGLADIAQCIRVILTTPKGSDPLRPEFGSDIAQYVDWPRDQALPHLVRACWEAITLWEPRVELDAVKPRMGDAPHQVVVAIVWRLAGAADLQSTEVAL